MNRNAPSSRTWLRVAVAAAAGPALWLPSPWQLIALAALLILWMGLGPSRRRVLTTGSLLVLAVILGLLDLSQSRSQAGEAPGPSGVSETLLARLDAEAEAVAKILSPTSLDRDERLASFRTLEERASASSGRDWTWLLVDTDGVAIAWSGRGLVHEFEPTELPRTGRIKRSGFSSMTWASVRPLSADRDPWRVVVGTSFETGQAAEPRSRFEPGRLGAGSALAVGLALICLGLSKLREAGAVVALAAFLGAVAAGGPGLWLSARLQILLVAALLAVFLVRPAFVPASNTRRLLHGAGAGVALLAASMWVQAVGGPIDLGSRFVGSWPEVLMRLALFLLALGFLPVGKADSAGSRSDQRRWAFAAFATLALGTAVHTFPVLAILLLLAGAAAAAVAVRADPGFGFQRVLLAALLAALSWEFLFHTEVDRALEQAVEVDLAPPTQTELDELGNRIDAYFEEVAWEGFVDAGEPRDLQDLAFAVWRDSPLSSVLSLSSVVIEQDDRLVSRFSLGLPISDEGELDTSPSFPEALLAPAWEDWLVQGAAPIRFGAETVGLARYWFVPRPGFRYAGSDPEAIATGLLRGGPGAAHTRGLLPGGARLGFYDSSGRVQVPPWQGVGNLEIGDALEVPKRVLTPQGRAAVFAAGSDAGWRAVFLPTPSFLESLERIATHALSPVLALFVIVCLEFLLRSTPKGLRGLAGRSWSSYSRRMLILAGALVVVPVLLLSGFVLRMLAERVQDEQRAAGQAALQSAQRILGDYVLALEPGFGIETTLDDELLNWLSGAVHHEVNLYWGSQLYASSKRELFSAGVLPPRIPGEIYSQLALQGAGMASRTSRAQETRYREFYAPLSVPGVPADAIQLFLSMPLLAQEEEAAVDIATMRRRVLIVAIFSALLLTAFGRRLVRTFTEPIMEIVQGTQRIADGSPGLGYAPQDRELANLAAAIDEMAERIAEARVSLLREKEVVDRIVDNITAGVVSVDEAGRVLLLNRTAHQLLGLAAGDPLIGALEERADLAGVADFVSESGGEPRQATAELGTEGDETRQWSLVWVPIEAEGEPTALFVIEDVTEVLRVQRLEAWAEMARIIAHEVKNPLTPIRLSAEHLREVHRSRPDEMEEVFERCTSNILEQVEELQHIAADFSTYSRIPEIKLEPGDVADEVRRLVETYRSAPPPGVSFEFTVDDGPTEASFDARLVSRAARNLIENAIRASEGGGAVSVTVSSGGSEGPGTGAENGPIRILVEDEGPGVEPALLTRIFEPYFSTEEHGTGLGLAIARRIAEEHGGCISAVNRPQGGLAVSMSIPR
ncbi:MAG: ATP-binding protein [Thermoanaerobaculia bacterium]